MNTRLQQFLSAENISQSQFADTIGVARASVSHILAGRNKPGFDFLVGMSQHYPSLNLEWLLTGKGRMYQKSGDNLFDDAEFCIPEKDTTPPKRPQSTHSEPVERPQNAFPKTEAKPSGKTISRIIVFYDDNTYQELV